MPGQDSLDGPIDQAGQQVTQWAQHGKQQHHLDPVRLTGNPGFDRIDHIQDGLPAHQAKASGMRVRGGAAGSADDSAPGP